MPVFRHMYSLRLRNSLTSSCPSYVKFKIGDQRMFTNQYSSFANPYSLPCKNTIVSTFPRFAINSVPRTSMKNLNFQINVCCTFQTSSPRNFHPIIWIVLRPALKVVAVITGRGIRKWWRSLPKDKQQYFLKELKANRWKTGIALALILCLSFGYYLSHLEVTPITKRRRFMFFNSKQLEIMNGLEPEEFMEDLSSQMLPNNHAAVRRVEKVVNRILVANADIKELEGKKFGVSVINSTVENAFVIPRGHVFVYAGMLNLCSNDDQLGAILSHEISHCILNHGAENMSYIHLLDILYLGIITAIWAVIPSDILSLLSNWLFSKCIKLFLELPYSRKMEVEADLVGLLLAAKALQLRTSCGCPRLSYKDPRIDVATMKASLELSRKKIEQNQKPKNIFKH